MARRIGKFYNSNTDLTDRTDLHCLKLINVTTIKLIRENLSNPRHLRSYCS
jgi:hypothetical protein